MTSAGAHKRSRFAAAAAMCAVRVCAGRVRDRITPRPQTRSGAPAAHRRRAPTRAAPRHPPAAATTDTHTTGRQHLQPAREHGAHHERQLRAGQPAAAPTRTRSPRTGPCCSRAKGLTSGHGRRVSRSAGRAHLERLAGRAPAQRRPAGLVVTVPKTAHSGHIMVLLSHGRHTSSYGPIYVVRYALHPPAPPKARRARRPSRRGQRHRVRRPGHVDLVREPLRRRQRRLDRRPGARGRREHAVRQELRRLDQLLEPVLAPSWWRNCTRTG